MTKEYWNDRWESGQTGWDLRKASPALVAYLAQTPMSKRDINILIPGCGNGYEALWLLQNGFTKVTMLDIAPIAIQQLKTLLNQSVPGWEAHLQLCCEDFFQHEGKYDLILEQTFFCALPPDMRPDYTLKMHQLLANNGKLVGLLFDRDFEGGPPFGGDISSYQALFSPFFFIQCLEKCYNSIDARRDTEVFIIFKKTNHIEIG